MTEQENSAVTAPIEQEHFILEAQKHTRSYAYEIDGKKHRFDWNRTLASELMTVAMGGGRKHQSESLLDTYDRIMVKSVSDDTKGIFQDVIKKPANHMLCKGLIERLLPKVTENETRILKVVGVGDLSAEVTFQTGDQLEKMVFTSSRERYADFQQDKSDDDLTICETAYNYYLSCLPDESKERFAELCHMAGNFTLQVKLIYKTNSFLFQDSATVKELSL